MNNASVDNIPIVSNANRLLWAGSLGIFAAGVGFAIRGGILDNWGAGFGFSAGQLGTISGACFRGYCFGVMAGGVVWDQLGYGRLSALAFACRVLYAIVLF